MRGAGGRAGPCAQTRSGSEPSPGLCHLLLLHMEGRLRHGGDWGSPVGEAPRADTHLVASRGAVTAPLETQAGSQPPQPHLVSCAALGQFPSLTWVSPSVKWGRGSPLPVEAFEVHGRDVSAPRPLPRPRPGAWPRRGRWFWERRWGPGSQEGRGCSFYVGRAAECWRPAAGPSACLYAGGKQQPGLCGPRGGALVLLTPAGALAQQSARS